MARRRRDGLEILLPPVGAWFRETFGTPTPPQRLGWPPIAACEHTLIFAPTGSGKTLAAFLACLDHLWRTPRTAPGVRILYISPLKALNQDVARNLQAPLEGIVAAAERLGTPLEPLRVAVRTGDTPAAERQRIVRKPPDILITTPESLHLMLTSRARETLRHVSHVLVDEIHAVAANKRGVFLSLLLERLEALDPTKPERFVRVGLSATQRPLDEVARYLGGLRRSPDGRRFEARPVTVIDAGRPKELDLQVSYPGTLEISSLARSVWPAIEDRLADLIAAHRSTIVFANNRRVAERLTARLNEALLESDDPAAEGLEPVAAHHGSLSTERRRSVEEALKAGELKAVVATASLELGIDMGAVDLVCQVESPGGIARGLQRVGRAGHVVGRTSKGRMLAKTPADLLESAALARAMLDGQVEALRVPTNCLDVLAQQVVACVAMDRWEVPALFDLVRSAYPYRELTPAAFESVLELVSGRFHLPSFRDLRPRVSWDRVRNRLHPLPGSARLALVGGGTIPDTGQYPLILGDGGPKLGELDEEFVLERRVGETFVFGTSTWRIEAIEPHRVVVSPAAGRSAQLPFWRGEGAYRSADLGAAVGAMTREIASRLAGPPPEHAPPGDRAEGDGPSSVLRWLRDDYQLDERSARALLRLVGRQLDVAGAAPDDRTVLVESFVDEAGETGLAVLTPFGGRLHHALKLVLQDALRRRLGIDAACLHGDEGLLFRIPGNDEPPTDLFRGLTSELAERSIRAGLGESALFGLRFRQNAGRALLMPRPDPSKRTPLWLQRLRAKDLLQAVRQVPDFPIVVETYRECLDHDLDLPRLRAFLDAIVGGSIRVVERRGQTPSPFAAGLVFAFTSAFLYEWDEPRRADRPEGRGDVTDGMLDPLLDTSAGSSYAPWLDPEAVGRVEGRLRGVGRPPRTVDEMAEWLRLLGDLAPSDLSGPMPGFLNDLGAQGRAVTIDLPGVDEPRRWVSDEDVPRYRDAFGLGVDHPQGGGETTEHRTALASIVRRYLRTRALVTVEELATRYPIEPDLAVELLEEWADEGGLVRVDAGPDVTDSSPRWADRANLDEVRRLAIALRRRESVAVTPEVYADYVARRQHVHPETRLEGPAAVGLVLDQLQGLAAPAELWEAEILPRRLRDHRPAWLDERLALDGWQWRAAGCEDARGESMRVAFVRRDVTDITFAPPSDLPEPLKIQAKVLGRLTAHGAEFTGALASDLGLPPSQIRAALDALMRRGQVTNDRFDPLRAAGRAMAEALDGARASDHGRARGPTKRPRLGSLRRRMSSVPEGRWSALREASPPLSEEQRVLAWAEVLLDRYGVLCRETAALDPWAPAWRRLFPVLDRAELRGELRRGYFVEGLSGIQYAVPETIEALSRLAGTAGGAAAPPILLHALDPANLYGSGAPLDVPLLEGGTARLPRNLGNYLVLLGGRPVLIVEAHGKRLTGLDSASEDELRSALGLLPSLAGPSRRVLKVESYNLAATLASPAAPWLAELGFVRDFPGMAFYATWS